MNTNLHEWRLMLGLVMMGLVSAAGPRAAETLRADKLSTITLAASTAELTTGGTINRSWWGNVPLKGVAESIGAAWTFSRVNADNVYLDGQALSTVSGALALEPYLNENLTIGATSGKHFLLGRDTEDAWVQFKNASTVRFELRDDNGIWELNRGANSSNSIAVNGASMGIGGDNLPDFPLEVVGSFGVSATADGDGDSFKVVSGLATIGAGDSGATVNTGADDLTIEAGATGGMSILTPAGAIGQVLFGRPSAAAHGRLEYAHATDKLGIYAGNAKALSVGATEIELTEGVEVKRGDYWKSKAVAYDDTYPVAIATVEDGYIVDDVYVEVLTPGNGTSYIFSVGDGDSSYGFMAQFDPSTVSAGNRRGGAFWGAYLPEGKLYGAADTVDAFYGSSNSDDTDWAAVVHVHFTRAK
jgi:hypothetical protein